MNNTFPKEISLEAGTWLRLQMTIAAARATQPLHAELQDIDGFLNGLLVAVAQLVPCCSPIPPWPPAWLRAGSARPSDTKHSRPASCPRLMTSRSRSSKRAI
jgi:hypothetical protein